MAGEAENTKNFVPVRASTLRAGAPLRFDVYVHFQDAYLPYKRKEDTLTADLLQRFREKKVKKVFIPTDQEALYLAYLDEALENLAAKDTAISERSDLAQATLRQESEKISRTLESESAYKESESRIHKVVDFILQEPAALAGMLKSAGLSVDDSAHGSTVSSLVLGVGAHSGLLQRDDLTDVAVAGLLHDTGLEALGFDTRADLNEIPKEKRADFRRHPAVAAELVAGKRFITPRVLRIIEDHEEYGEGLGFPEKKWMAKLSDASRIFNLCDAFDHFCLRAGKAATECVEDFINARADHFDLKLIEVLEKQVKML